VTGPNEHVLGTPLTQARFTTRFLPRLAIQNELAVAHGYPVPRQADDALYEGLCSAFGVAEEDYVSTLGFFEIVGEFVDENPVVRTSLATVERGLHASRADIKGGRDDGANETEYEGERDQEYHGDLQQALKHNVSPGWSGTFCAHLRVSRCGAGARSRSAFGSSSPLLPSLLLALPSRRTMERYRRRRIGQNAQQGAQTANEGKWA
jgi:hypothetical protein